MAGRSRRVAGAAKNGATAGAPPKPERRPAPSSPREPVGKVDRVLAVPLSQLFSPDPDPTKDFPGQSTEVEGYVVTPGQVVTVALTAPVPEGVDLLDSIWSVLRRKGIGLRRMVLLDDRGRMVSLMTLQLRASTETIRLFESMLLVPVHAGDGFAEVHFLAGSCEVEALESEIHKNGRPFPPPLTIRLPAARGNTGLRPDEWAFLGLLSALGVLDGPDGPTAPMVAELLGIDTATLAERARAVERGLEGVVTGLFSWPSSHESEEGVPS